MISLFKEIIETVHKHGWNGSMKVKLPCRYWSHRVFAAVVAGLVVLVISTWAVDSWMMLDQKFAKTAGENRRLAGEMASISAELAALKNQDQYKRNQALQSDIVQIESAYMQTVAAYEDLLRLKDNKKDLPAGKAGTAVFDAAFADVLSLLAQKNYTDAGVNLKKLRADIQAQQDKIAASFIVPANVPASNAAPESGYSRQSVTSDIGNFLVDLVAADLGSTKVLVDTASDGTCAKDCPVLPLGDYVSRSGAYAGVNGSYFCPADYPSCADRKNSFDTLLMNKNKVYFNSDNNKYSTVPAVIFGSGFIRFVGQSLEWGRDTGIDSMIANQPLLLSGGNIVFGGNSDPKMGSTGARGFVGNRGNTVYIGVIHSVTVPGMAHVLKALGMENALNLDSGGSVALWSGGYRVGPGRNIPNAIVFVKK